MKRLLLTGLALVLMAGGALAASVEAAFDYALKPQRLADGVYAFIGHTEDFDTVNGGNIANAAFIVAPEGVIVVDSGSSLRYGRQMRAAIAAVTDKPVALVINTHHHPDHFLGNQAFADVPIGALAENPFVGGAFQANPDNWRRESFVAPGAPRAAWVGVRYLFGGR